MKEYIKPSIKQKTLLSESALLENSITEGEINPDEKHFNVWDD